MSRPSARRGLGIACAAALAFALHGYHFGIADQKLYLPAALALVDPSLYPHDAPFFAIEARFTWYDELVAAVLRGGIPLDVAMFVGQIGAVVLLLSAARRLLERCGATPAAQWAGTVALAIALPVPVAGTRIGVLEPYLLPRGLGIGLATWAAVFALDRRARTLPLLAAAAALHPLTGVWSAGHVLALAWPIRGSRRIGVVLLAVAAIGAAACVGPAPPAVNEATFWRTALEPDVFGIRYPLHWPWYEWLGVLAPLAVLGGLSRDRHLSAGTRDVAWRLTVSTAVGVVLAVAFTLAPSRQWPVQPMRHLHLVYVASLALLGGWTETRVLRGRMGRRALVAVVAAASVVVLQQGYPASPHIEWPGRLPDNAYVRAFDWVRTHTTVDTRIAIDPFYLRRPGPDWHSARVFTRRSMLSDAVHDLAPAAMNPALAERWTREQQGLSGWTGFSRGDFARLRRDFAVDWVVVAGTQGADLDCPFAEPAVRVCRTP